MTDLKQQNLEQSIKLGCDSALLRMRDAGTSEQDIAKALHVLEHTGWDACVQYLEDATNGAYPPRSGLLRRYPPKHLVSSGEPGREYEARRMTWWDCLEIKAATKAVPGTIDVNECSHRLFGNTNIGLPNATNMQVGGCLAADQDVYLAGWSVTSNVAKDEYLSKYINELFVDSLVGITFGDKPQSLNHMVSLYKEAQPLDLVLPVRQWMRVDVDFDLHALRRLRYKIGERAVRIWVNLEGWQIRTHG